MALILLQLVLVTFTVNSSDFRPHRMHEIRTIATDIPVAWCFIVSQSVTRRRCAKTSEQIEVLFAVEIFGPRNIALGGGSGL